MRRAAIVVLLAGTPVVAWYSMGRLDEPGAFPEPDYAVAPPDLPLALEWALGVGAGVAVIAALAVLVRHRLDRDAWLATFAGMVVGVWLAFVGRVATSAVSGANIGFGLLLLLTPVVVGVLGSFAFARARRRPGGSRGVEADG